MSTKATIAHGDNFHIYQEMFEEDNVYLQIDQHGGFVSIENGRINFSLPPSLLDLIAKSWIENKDKLDQDLGLK
tara:strand:+ start:765 stop:986 length:222 start_codon:yes stop_codon:yes gene_type:complete